MGIVGFQWGDNQLTLLMNRDNWETRVINEAHWVGGILGGRCEETNGTWFGVTRSGRVAFLLDSELMLNMIDEEDGRCSEMLPIEFLQSKLSPEVFAAQLVEDEQLFHSQENDDADDDDNEDDADDDDNEDDADDDHHHDEIMGRAYNLIVADITSGSMVHISKPSAVASLVNTQPVAFGVHTLSLQGLDSNSPKDIRLRNLFNEMIVQELPPMNELAARFMYDTTETVPGDELTALFVDKMSELPSSQLDNERYGTTSTTAFSVNPTNKAMFYERYFENGIWNENDFTFNIA